MAPKRGLFRKRPRQMEPGQGSANNETEPNYAIVHDNRYFFRNLQAYENYVGQFQERKLCKCYFFDKSRITFSTREDDKILDYLKHWNWEPLITCFEQYLEFTTRLFYANLIFKENPFLVSSWVCGQEIKLTLANIAEWLNLPNEGEETYLLRNWPTDHPQSAEAYKLWFDKSNVFGAAIYATPLPSLHRLLFLLVNNILIPKSKIKTNIEHGPMYYLRHLIQLDTTTLNIPYIILRHMQSAYRSTVASLPYGHIIHKIIRLNGIALPSDLPTDRPYLFPESLVNHLTRIGWVKTDSNAGLPMYKPDGRDINDWIFHPEALPNQYWNPDEEQADLVPPVQNPPQYNPQFMPMPQAGQPFPFPPIPATLEEQMQWMCQRMQEQYVSIGNLQAGMTRMEGKMNEHAKALATLDERQESLSNRFVKRFGASSSPIPSPNEQGDEEEEEGEEVQAEDQQEEEDERNDMHDD